MYIYKATTVESVFSFLLWDILNVKQDSNNIFADFEHSIKMYHTLSKSLRASKQLGLPSLLCMGVQDGYSRGPYALGTENLSLEVLTSRIYKRQGNVCVFTAIAKLPLASPVFFKEAR